MNVTYEKYIKGKVLNVYFGVEGLKKLDELKSKFNKISKAEVVRHMMTEFIKRMEEEEKRDDQV